MSRHAYARRVWQEADRRVRWMQRAKPPTCVQGWAARAQYCLVVAHYRGVMRSRVGTIVLPPKPPELRPSCDPAFAFFTAREWRELMKRQRATAMGRLRDAVRPLWHLVEAEQYMAAPEADRPRCGRTLCRWRHTCDRPAYHDGPCKSAMGCGGGTDAP